MPHSLRSRGHLLGLCVGLVLAGCSAQGVDALDADVLTNAVQHGEVQLVVNRAAYRGGDTLVATVQNETSLQLIHGACSLALQHHLGGTWVPAEQPPAICTMQAFLVRPGSSETLRKVVRSAVAPGEYRVVLTLYLDEPSSAHNVAVPSNSFQIE